MLLWGNVSVALAFDLLPSFHICILVIPRLITAELVHLTTREYLCVSTPSYPHSPTHGVAFRRDPARMANSKPKLPNPQV